MMIQRLKPEGVVHDTTAVSKGKRSSLEGNGRSVNISSPNAHVHDNGC